MAEQADYAGRSVSSRRWHRRICAPFVVQLSKQLGRPVVIDNRGGAGGTVGASIAAKEPPDGYTFFHRRGSPCDRTSFYPKLDYNIETDLVPLTIIANPPQVIVVNPTRVKADNFKDFLDFVRKNPGQAELRVSRQRHLAPSRRGVVQDSKQDVHHSHSYQGRGSGAECSACRQCRHDVRRPGLVGAAHSLGSYQAAGDRVAEAFAGVSQSADDRGSWNADYVVSTWYGIWGVKGTPKEILDRMHAEVVKAVCSGPSCAISGPVRGRRRRR